MESPPSSEGANISRLCVFPSLQRMMQLNTNYDLVEYTMVVTIVKSLLMEEKLDMLGSLVTFVALAAVLPVIRTANLTPLHLKCAPKKSSFQHSTQPLHLNKTQDTPTPKHEHGKRRGGAECSGQGVK